MELSNSQNFNSPTRVFNPNKPLATNKSVTYDDILSSLNMKVVDGKLQIVRNTTVEKLRANPELINQHMKQNARQAKSVYQQPVYQPVQQPVYQPVQQPVYQPVQQPVYQQHVQQPVQQHVQQDEVYLTPAQMREQIKRINILNNIKLLQQRQRINSIKSTKLMFSNTNITIAQNPQQNKLFRFSGK
jgi:hypothetical protein